MLGGERDHRRGAPERRRHRAAVEVVGAHDAEARLLLDMGMAVDAARQDELVAGVDLADRRALQARLDRGDLAVLDADVSFGLAILGDDPRVANNQIVVGHNALTPPPACGFGPTTPAGVRGEPSSTPVPRDRSPSATSPARAGAGS